jgi:bifunctional enzyme CysN/CysC
MTEPAPILRFATAGSVDDGKSTLIGRLLYDSKSIFEDQLAAVERTSKQMGPSTPTWRCSPTACGPSASRASPSTWPTATSPRRAASSSSPTPPATFSTPATWSPGPPPPTWRSCWSTPARACSSRAGATPSSPRCWHPHLVLAVNKMDLVDYSEERFDEIKDEFRTFAAKLDISDLTFIPVSALHGDNVVTRPTKTPWYEGPSLLHHLEEVHIAVDRNLIDARFPVQYVIRPPPSTTTTGATRARWPAASSSPATRWWCCPRAFTTTIAAIDTMPTGRSPRPSTHVGHDPPERRDRHQPRRHDLPAANQPTSPQDIDAMVCWMSDTSTLRGPSWRSSTPPAPPGAWSRRAVPARHQHAAPGRGRTAQAQRDRPGDAAHHRSRCSSTSTAATADRLVHPDRRGHQRHRRRRHDPRHRPGRRSRGRDHDVTWHAGEIGRCRRKRSAPGARRVAHRAVGLGQVDGGGRGRAEASSVSGRPRSSSTATTCATGSTPTSAFRRPTGREHASGGRGGPADGRGRRWW